jgi:3-phenylpropionate/trans-cinnamate dioxygenase ferredoxin subunit
MRVKYKNLEICLVKSGDKIYALEGYCTHEYKPLYDGYLEENGIILVCPWHAARFDIRSGKVQDDTPWASDLETFKVKVEGEDILLKVEDEK